MNSASQSVAGLHYLLSESTTLIINTKNNKKKKLLTYINMSTY